MYSETNRYAAVRRTNDEFLRRMLGGELGCVQPRGESQPQKPPICHLFEKPQSPACNQNDAHGAHQHDGGRCSSQHAHNGCQGKGGCPKQIPAPSLAMVYAPRQCWEGLLKPMDALAHGSLFSALVLPLEVEGKNGRKEGCSRKCDLR